MLDALYSIRSERAFCERLNDLLFKWFLVLRVDEPRFDATTFTKHRRRLLDHDVAERVLRPGQAASRYMPSDHFSVDRTLLEAWASTGASTPNTVPRDRQARAGTPTRTSTARSRSNETRLDHRS